MSNSQVLISFANRPTSDQISSWWPNLEFCEQQMAATWDDAIDWATTRDGYLDGPTGKSVKAIFRCGRRWVLADFSMLMFGSEVELSAASQEVGDIYLAMTQGTAGCAGFRMYSGGKRIRSINYVDGDVHADGAPLEQESEIDIDELYDRELNKLWVILGHDGLLFDMEPKEIECILFTDEDELAMVEATPEPRPETKGIPPKKPWWKLW